MIEYHDFNNLLLIIDWKMYIYFQKSLNIFVIFKETNQLQPVYNVLCYTFAYIYLACWTIYNDSFAYIK